jgi:hypothetical protein
MYIFFLLNFFLIRAQTREIVGNTILTIIRIRPSLKALEHTGSKLLILKRLITDTRCADAEKAFLCGFTTIKQVLGGISNKMDQWVEYRNQAHGLVSKMS